MPIRLPTLAVSFLAALVLAGFAGAPAPDDPAALMVTRGREALDAGQLAEAAVHFERALAHRPRSTELLELLVRASADDADARGRWAHELLLAASDARGKSGLARALADEVRSAAPEAEAVVAARFAAVDELVEFAAARTKRARSRPDEALVAWWADELAQRLARVAPALAARVSSDTNHAVQAPAKLASDVAKELKRALSAAQGAGRASESVQLARILAGLGNQAGSDKLQGGAPADAKELEAVGREALAKARARLIGVSGAALTLEELEVLDRPEQLAFTREHADFANPGVAVSATGLYRVETICGYETLYGAASTVELHHKRLAAWFGVDPFTGIQGTVRIDPEAAGLESESSPFWWAGGFQGGDLTVLRFSCGTIAGLGRGLTHELTHRFDGLVHPGMPPWLAEGRAVWTAASYRSMESQDFVENAVSVGTVESAYIKGYGNIDNLRKLLDGSIDDYRDNYVAGYALFVYLKSWAAPDGRLLFAEPLGKYMKALLRVRGTPIELFEAYFADGSAGRPVDLAAFATNFAEFLRGFYWQSRAAWVDRYATDVGHEEDGLVFDEPSWTWARRRAEPFYGDEHAFRAGRVLAQIGRDDEAINAFVWSASVDERVRWRAFEMADFFASKDRRDAAWVLRNDVERERRRALDVDVVAAPFLAELPRTQAFLAALEEAATIARAAGREHTADLWLGRHDELAAALGAPLLLAAPAVLADEPCRAHEPWRLLGLDGWEDAGLTDYEERRVANLWHVDEQRDIHVGREAPRTGTGTLDRTGYQRDAFALASDWMQPGRYRLRCRVQFTTSFVSGALVLGWTRRDRNVRVNFSAGDFMYSIGSKAEADVIEGVGWSVDGLREREGALVGSLSGGSAKFETPRENFTLEVVVDGACAQVWLEGQRVATYHTPDGAPIEGRMGFATGFGAIRVIAPEVQRLDASWMLDGDSASAAAVAQQAVLDVRQPPAQPFDQLINRPVLGLPVSARGTLVVWVPLPDVDEANPGVDSEAVADGCRRQMERAARLLERYDAALPIAVCVPALLGSEPIDALRNELAALHPAALLVVAYPGAPILFDVDSEDARPAAGSEWLLFVDATGVLRYAALSAPMETVPVALVRWIGALREHAGR
jgi:hypothetical protein